MTKLFLSRQVGEVKKLAPQNLADVAKEIATDADKFTISFPQDLKVTLQSAHDMRTS